MSIEIYIGEYMESAVLIPVVPDTFYFLPYGGNDPSYTVEEYAASQLGGLNAAKAAPGFKSCRYCPRAVGLKDTIIKGPEHYPQQTVFVHKVGNIDLNIFVDSNFLFDLILLNIAIKRYEKIKAGEINDPRSFVEGLTEKTCIPCCMYGTLEPRLSNRYGLVSDLAKTSINSSYPLDQKEKEVMEILKKTTSRVSWYNIGFGDIDIVMDKIRNLLSKYIIDEQEFLKGYKVSLCSSECLINENHHNSSEIDSYRESIWANKFIPVSSVPDILKDYEKLLVEWYQEHKEVIDAIKYHEYTSIKLFDTSGNVLFEQPDKSTKDVYDSLDNEIII